MKLSLRIVASSKEELLKALSSITGRIESNTIETNEFTAANDYTYDLEFTDNDNVHHLEDERVVDLQELHNFLGYDGEMERSRQWAEQASRHAAEQTRAAMDAAERHIAAKVRGVEREQLVARMRRSTYRQHAPLLLVAVLIVSATYVVCHGSEAMPLWLYLVLAISSVALLVGCAAMYRSMTCR